MGNVEHKGFLLPIFALNGILIDNLPQKLQKILKYMQPFTLQKGIIYEGKFKKSASGGM